MKKLLLSGKTVSQKSPMRLEPWEVKIIENN